MSRDAGLGDELYFQSLNDAPHAVSIVFLHGLTASHLEWEHVAKQPQLSAYHLLLIDLPEHSRSKHIQPFSLQLAADKVSSIITKHAHGGKAHLVGLSLGGFVTLEIIRRHADVVRTAFVTGTAPFFEWQKRITAKPKLLSWLSWGVHRGGLYRLQAWQAGLLPHEELMKEMAGNNTEALNRHGFGELREWKLDIAQELAQKDKRMLLAGGDRDDNLDGVKELARLIRESADVGAQGKLTRAYSVDGACHGWNLQFPELFASGIRAWIEEQPLPRGFTQMDDVE